MALTCHASLAAASQPQRQARRGKPGSWQEGSFSSCQVRAGKSAASALVAAAERLKPGKEGWQDDRRPNCHLPALPLPSARGAGEEHQMSPDEH